MSGERFTVQSVRRLRFLQKYLVIRECTDAGNLLKVKREVIFTCQNVAGAETTLVSVSRVTKAYVWHVLQVWIAFIVGPQ